MVTNFLIQQETLLPQLVCEGFNVLIKNEVSTGMSLNQHYCFKKAAKVKPSILHVEQQRWNDFVHMDRFPDVTLQVVCDCLAYNTLKTMQAGKPQPTITHDTARSETHRSQHVSFQLMTIIY